MAATNRDFIDQLDAAIGCQQCGRPLGNSPSNDFCGEVCQEHWHVARAAYLPADEEPWELGPSGVIAAEALHHSAAVTAAAVESSAFPQRWFIGDVGQTYEFDADGWRPLGTIDAAAAAALSHHSRPVGVTPDGEVVGRDGDQLRSVDHVVVQPDTRQFRESLRRAGGGLNESHIIPTGERVRSLERAVERLARQAGVSVEQASASIPMVPFGWSASIAEVAARAAEAQDRWAAIWGDVFSAVDRLAEDAASPQPGRLGGLTFECNHVDPNALRLFLGGTVESEPVQDARERALELRRNRNTGPSTSTRAPRSINPRRGR